MNSVFTYTYPPRLRILLADDDEDDCLMFKEALEELQLRTELTQVHNGEQLMKLLKNPGSRYFDVLFLDLNMPRKNGFECLDEIKQNDNLNSLPVIIFSTSYDQRIAESLYLKGAQYYICKPAGFSELRNTIQHALSILAEVSKPPVPNQNFLIRM